MIEPENLPVTRSDPGNDDQLGWYVGGLGWVGGATAMMDRSQS